MENQSILREYKDCTGLLILQEVLSPNPPNGSYTYALDDLLNLSKEKTLRSRIFEVSDDTLSECKTLEEYGLVKIEPEELNRYKLTLTKNGVAWLIRDRLEQLKEFNKLNDEIIEIYLSRVKIEDD